MIIIDETRGLLETVIDRYFLLLFYLVPLFLV
jgi:hypothetical protein